MTVVALNAVSGTRDFTKFDAYVDAQGLVFAAGEGLEPATQLQPLRPTRQDTGQNSWEVRPESGDIFSQGDWWLGMGQEKFHAPGEDRYRKYLWSRGIDIAKPGRVTNRRAFAESDSSRSYTAFAVANNTLFGTTGSALYKTTDLTTWSSETISANVQPTWLTSTGTELFSLGRNTSSNNGVIYKRDSSGTHTAWLNSSSYTPALGAWLKDRLIWFCSETDALYEQVAIDTPTLIQEFEPGWDAQSIFVAGAYIYVIMYSAAQRKSIIYHYGPSADATAIEPKGQTELPTGINLFCGVGYVGLVFLGGAIADTENTTRSVFLRAAPDDNGFLQYLKEAEGYNGNVSTSPQLRVASMHAAETEVLMDWRTDGTDDLLSGTGSGVAIYDFARGAFSLSGKVAITASTSGSTFKTAITKFLGRIVYSVENLAKTYAEVATDANGDCVREATGTLISSIADWHNAGVKNWIEGEIGTSPIPAGGSVKVYTTTKHPEEQDWTLATTYNTQNGEGTTFDITAESRIFAVKIEINRGTDTTLAPEVLNYSFESHPKPSAPRWRLTRFVRIMDLDAKDHGGEEIRQNPETVREWLFTKAYEPVTLYESGATWDVILKDIGDVEPGHSIYSQTAGDPGRDAFVMRLVFEGTRS